MNDFDFDPTAADLAEVDDLLADDFSDLTEDGPVSDDESEWFTDDEYAPHDDRWDGDGVPAWSAWA